ncbi:transmembrane protein, putative [Medicago truncatula]|uniref:Transmembrane protein, putative n=1 Tax=Medicago truncatula TaxID=3880 RepID=A0A072TDZ2_MEDTR|nr:transmembrane protein, putative [Medicago truncatula]
MASLRSKVKQVLFLCFSLILFLRMVIADDGTFMSKLAKSLSPTPSGWSSNTSFCLWTGVTTQFIKFEPVPTYLELSFILFCIISSIAILKSKKISKITKKLFFYIFLKSVNNKHILFELVSRWSIHRHPSRERLYSERETWLSIVERTSVLSKMQS